LVILCCLKPARLLDFHLIEVPSGVHPLCVAKRISSIR
jgi:hypothetical protein